ncbi:MAG: hypothetical protein MI749_00830 [Desulfovibrionales bacterium]|nr:hypothetical protein [Desulfovibrionales bacterium]
MVISIDTLDRFRKGFELFEGFVRVKHNKSDKATLQKTDTAPNFKYIIINSDPIHWIHIDVDLKEEALHTFQDPFIYDEVYLPRPNFVIHNSNGAHLLWYIGKAFPVAASPKTIFFHNNIRSRLISYFKGDANCPKTNLAAKNPFFIGYNHEKKDGRSINFTCSSYSLHDFIPFLEATSDLGNTFYTLKNEQSEYVQGNRNNATYSMLARRYKQSRFKLTEEELLKIATNFQSDIQGVRNLDPFENQRIVRSVLKLGNKTTNYAFRNYGAMLLPKILGTGEEAQIVEQIKKHQHLGALHTAEKKKNKRIDAIKEAINIIRKDKKKLTARAIALHLGIRAKTVRKYLVIKKGKLRWRRHKSNKYANPFKLSTKKNGN